MKKRANMPESYFAYFQDGQKIETFLLLEKNFCLNGFNIKIDIRQVKNKRVNICSQILCRISA
jgi:hypothetical protein